MCQVHNPTERISAKSSPRGLRLLPFGLWFFLSRKLLLTFKLHHYQLEGSQCSELEKQEVGTYREGDRGVGAGGGGLRPAVTRAGLLSGNLAGALMLSIFLPRYWTFLKTPERLKKKKNQSLGKHLVLLFPP